VKIQFECMSFIIIIEFLVDEAHVQRCWTKHFFVMQQENSKFFFLTLFTWLNNMMLVIDALCTFPIIFHVQLAKSQVSVLNIKSRKNIIQSFPFSTNNNSFSSCLIILMVRDTMTVCKRVVGTYTMYYNETHVFSR